MEVADQVYQPVQSQYSATPSVLALTIQRQALEYQLLSHSFDSTCNKALGRRGFGSGSDAFDAYAFPLAVAVGEGEGRGEKNKKQ